MKKIAAMLLSMVLILAGLAVRAEGTAPTAEELADEYLRPVCALEHGTAGASLKLAAAAAATVEYAAARNLRAADLSALPEAWDSLTEEEREAFAVSFRELDALIGAWEDSLALFGDAGVAGAMASRMADPADWQALREATLALLPPAGEDEVKLSDDASDFVLLAEAVPDVILEIRYYSTYNFVGDRIDGYEEPVALLTREAAAALKEVSDELMTMGYRLKIYDAYRPQRAVTHFMNWALDFEDVRMKPYFYPELEKDVLFPLGYIAEHSGHSRGSTVDLTLFDMTTEKEVDMGGTFDYFGELSHPDYTGITEEQYANRMILRDVMVRHGFKPLVEEWWHFTLADEPYPDTYFTFPVSRDSVQ